MVETPSESVVVSNPIYEEKAPPKKEEVVSKEEDIEECTDEVKEVENPDDAQTFSTKTTNIVDQLKFINLSDDYEEICSSIKDIIPEFTITDGSVSFKSFYKSKVEQISMIYKKFKFIDCQKRAEEIEKFNMNHFVGNAVSIDIIRSKLDQIQQHKCRLSEIRIKIHRTFPVWKRLIELLRGKLFKDHESRGQHKREGLCLEHMSDIEHYYSDLEGLHDAAKILDDLLSAGIESLSRQLTCILEENKAGGASGFSYHMAEQKEQIEDHKNNTIKKDTSLDKYDDINDGEKVKLPSEGRKLPKAQWSMSSPDDPLAGVGS